MWEELVDAMNFHLTAEEESLRESVAEFVRNELAPLESEFAYAPDIFEGSRWKSRVKSSADPEVQSLFGDHGGVGEDAPKPKGCGISTCPKPMAAWKSATSP